MEGPRSVKLRIDLRRSLLNEYPSPTILARPIRQWEGWLGIAWIGAAG